MEKIKKTKAHRALLRRHHLCPLLWSIAGVHPEVVIVRNRVTGNYTALFTEVCC